LAKLKDVFAKKKPEAPTTSKPEDPKKPAEPKKPPFDEKPEDDQDGDEETPKTPPIKPPVFQKKTNPLTAPQPKDDEEEDEE
jgi:hypothetical protein